MRQVVIRLGKRKNYKVNKGQLKETTLKDYCVEKFSFITRSSCVVYKLNIKNLEEDQKKKN